MCTSRASGPERARERMMARPKPTSSEDVHHCHKGERPKKSPKTKDGKSKSSKKKEDACVQQQSANGGGVRGQSQSCHQCRQSIHSSKGVSEVKSGRERLKCSKCTRYWCEQCLHNRYGLVKSEQDPTSWICPVCSGNCNCSLCRKKAGKLATGILTPLVKSAGFGSVSDFLDKGTDDIAKVLQWKSPEVASEATGQAKKRKSEGSAQGTEVKTKRRRPSQEDRENSTVVANTPSPIGDRHGNKKLSSSGGKRSGGRCGNGKPKHRRLSHPSYSITVDEDSIDLESSAKAKNPPDVTTPPSTPLSSTQESESPAKEETCEDGKSTIALTPSKHEASDSSPNVSAIESASPFRRSQRKRTTTRRYSSHDFRPLSEDEEEEAEDSFLTSPRRKRNKSRSSNSERRVSFRSPLCSSKSAESVENDDGDLDGEFVLKQQELNELRSLTLNSLRENKLVSRQEAEKEKARLRDEAKQKRLEERRKFIEERAKLREEEKVKKVAAQEKMKLARNLLKEAQRDARKRQKEREKVRKQEELQLLKEKRQTERRMKQELTSAPIIRAANEDCIFEDDSPSDCEAAGLPSLPDLPNFDLPLSPYAIPQFLFVSEFLYTFADALDLKRRLSARELVKLMSGGRGLGDLYFSLLKVLVDEDSQLHKQLKPSKRQRELEEIAKTYLHDVGKNGFIRDTVHVQSIEESLTILHHLCEEAISSSAVVEHMEACHEQVDQLRRDERAREREKSKEISEQLKQLCEGGACSIEDIETKRKEFTVELEEMRKNSEQEQSSCRLAIRNTYLGMDRYGRIYWKLQSIPGLVVEVSSCSSDGESSVGDGSDWMVVNSSELLDEMMAALHPRGRREKQLLDSLTLHKTDIITQIKSSTHQARVKKFYGSN